MGRPGSYFVATRHPWSCLIFVLPLLLIYEIGVHVLNQGHADAARNGADSWLRLWLAHGGLEAPFWAPVLLLAILVLWSVLRRGDRPEDFLAIWVGMAVESAIYAFGLWGLSLVMGPVLDGLGVKVTGIPNLLGHGICCHAGETARASTMSDRAVQQIVGFIGAGIYEESLFRLLLFSGLLWVLRLAEFPWPVSTVMAALAAALLFSAAHNLGPNGEAFNGYVFVFRALAGIYFTLLYHFRGFGIAVGAHAGYDVLVGVLIA